MGGAHLISWRSSVKRLRLLGEEGFLPQDRNPAYASSLPAHPTDFRLARFHKHVSQFFKINLYISIPISIFISIAISYLYLCLTYILLVLFCFSGEPWLTHSASICTSCVILSKFHLTSEIFNFFIVIWKKNFSINLNRDVLNVKQNNPCDVLSMVPSTQ